MKRAANVCIIVVMSSSVFFAQTAKTPSSGRKPPGRPVETRSEADEMRAQQLRVLRDHVLARAVDNIKKMDEAGLRVSARNQLLSYLADHKGAADENQTLATQIARDALTDLREHNEEITPFMLGYLANDLGSWIQKHRPGLTAEFEKTLKASAKVDASQRIRALFQLKDGDILAVKRIRQELEEQRALDGLNFWLDELMRRNSKEFEPLASDIVARAGQGQISLETLFWVSDIYLRPQTSNALRNQFLRTVVMRTQPADFVVESAPQIAYDLLTKLLPSIQQLTPELYDDAVNQSFALRAALNERQLASEMRSKRLRESVDPIADLKTEAESAKTKAERNELLLQAAQLALEKKKYDSCLAILDEVDVEASARAAVADAESWQRAIDQMLKNVVRASLTARLTDVAEKGASRVASSLTKVEALILIMWYYTKANDKEAAERLLVDASKAAGSGPDKWATAKAFMILSIACEQVDRLKRADSLMSGIKALNNLSKPEANARDKGSYPAYVQRLDNTGYELTRGFIGLAKQDENSALALVEKLENRDLKTFALIGILFGLDGLLTQPAL